MSKIEYRSDDVKKADTLKAQAYLGSAMAGRVDGNYALPQQHHDIDEVVIIQDVFVCRCTISNLIERRIRLGRHDVSLTLLFSISRSKLLVLLQEE